MMVKNCCGKCLLCGYFYIIKTELFVCSTCINICIGLQGVVISRDIRCNNNVLIFGARYFSYDERTYCSRIHFCLSNIMIICDGIIKNSTKIFDRYFGMCSQVAYMIIMAYDDYESSIHMLHKDIIYYTLKLIYRNSL